MAFINVRQISILVFMKEWAHTKEGPVPQKEIIIHMEHIGTKSYTTKNAINSLLNKEYIRRGYSEKANQSCYVMIRNI